MQQGPTIRIGLVAEIAHYAITIIGDTVTVTYRDTDRAGELVTTQRVTNLAHFVERARELRVALAQFPDFEVVYLFDLTQDGRVRLRRQPPGAALLRVRGGTGRTLAGTTGEARWLLQLSRIDRDA